MTSSHQNRAGHRLIVMTGGGTAGHVMPNLALLPDLLQAGYQVQYIGSKDIEAELVASAQIPFHQISSGKLRRYASWENFLDIFKVLLGTLQAFFLMLRGLSAPRRSSLSRRTRDCDS